MLKAAVKLASCWGKGKLPRFIYHLTSKKNYESILKSGNIQFGSDFYAGSGIFTVDLKNFFKHWNIYVNGSKDSLQTALIEQAAKDTNEIVILRIPTKNLRASKLRVRSQQKLFDWENTEMLNSIKSREIKAKTHKLFCELDFIKAPNNVRRPPKAEVSAIPYNRKKQAVEYIYRDHIPLSSDVQKIGEVHLEKVKQSPAYDPLRPIRSVFTELLKGTPEVKGAQLLKC